MKSSAAIKPGTGVTLASMILITLVTVGLSAWSPAPFAQKALGAEEAGENEDFGEDNPFPGRFAAPPLDGGDWINTDRPLSLTDDLRGKVVLLDFWTFCCINCLHVLPDLHYLEETFPNELAVVGVHVPKFDNEKKTSKIRDAVLKYDIAHPVVNDRENTIARAYGFRSWPTLVLIDPEGRYVGYLSGEGNRETLEQAISAMIAFHKKKGTLNETPLTFTLERTKSADTPLRYPGKVLADGPGGRVFISDTAHNRIVIASSEGRLLETIGGPNKGLADGSFADARFDHPRGLALIENTLYVADTENHALRAVDLTTNTVSTLTGDGQQARFRTPGGPLGETRLNSPWDLQLLGDTLYIAMAGPHQLWRHRLGSDSINLWAGSGREDVQDGPLVSAHLSQPSGLATDGESIYFADSEGSAVRKATPGGRVDTVAGPRAMRAGAALFSFGDKDGPGPDARFQHPLGIAVHDGRLFVADTYNHKLRRVAPTDGTTTSWLGGPEAGNALSPVQFNEPSGLSVAADWLYVADTNNHRIVRVNLTTQAAEEFVVNGLTP